MVLLSMVIILLAAFWEIPAEKSQTVPSHSRLELEPWTIPRFWPSFKLVPTCCVSILAWKCKEYILLILVFALLQLTKGKDSLAQNWSPTTLAAAILQQTWLQTHHDCSFLLPLAQNFPQSLARKEVEALAELSFSLNHFSTAMTFHRGKREIWSQQSRPQLFVWLDEH